MPILVIDDDEALLRTIGRTLIRSGHEETLAKPFEPMALVSEAARLPIRAPQESKA